LPPDGAAKNEVKTMIARIVMAALAGAVLLPVAADAQPPAQAPKNECFFTSQLDNWRAAGDRAIIIKTRANRYYRLDMGARCPALTFPNPVMVNRFRGASICSPLDWDIRISQGPGSIAMSCTVSKMTRLSPAEVAALPKGQKP
jgi:hypothetical protein